MDAGMFRQTLITDAGLIGILLLLGVWLRAKSKFCQWLMLPAPVIAGFLGFLLGPNVLGALAENYGWRIGSFQLTGLPFSSFIGSYTTILIAVVFAALSISQSYSLAKLTADTSSFTGYGILMSAGQVAVGMVLAFALLQPVFDAPMSLGLILFAAWSGGFGTSAAIGDVFAANGEPEITSIAFTAATVGMLAGIVGGVILTKIGAAKGQTRLGVTAQLPESMRTGILKQNERTSLGSHTVSGSSIETFALHAALVGTVLGIGYLVQTQSAAWLGDFSLPLFATAFLVGLVFRFLLAKTGGTQVIDQNTTKSISGSASDILIVCGMISIQPSFVAAHLNSLIAIFILGLVFCLILGLFVAPKMLGNAWFEKQIFTWGWATGSVATGIALLRIVDPELESGTVEDFGYAYLPLIPIEGAAVAIAPLLVVAGHSWAVALIWAALAAGGVFMMLAGQKRSRLKI